MGTYNYCSPSNFLVHNRLDVIPYNSWNNTTELKGKGLITNTTDANNNYRRYDNNPNAKQHWKEVNRLCR